MKNKQKKSVKRHFKEIEKLEGYAPKKFGEQKGVTYEMKGLAETFCSVNEWANGEGFDISWETMKNTSTKDWESKALSLHTDELEVFIACLMDLGHFD